MKINLSNPLVFTALQMEARALTGLRGPCGPCTVEIIGLRACRLRGDLAERGASCIIMAGLAGALDPSLKIGDVVVDDPQGLAPAGSWRRGAIHTSDHCVGSGAEKADLFRRTGAIAVDMENTIVRRTAQAASIPFIGLRAVSDGAQQEIDPRVFDLIDETGRPKPLAVAGLLSRNPWMIPQLMRLSANVKIATGALAAAAKTLFNDR